MTFQEWSQYQVKILFDGWDVQTKGQFAASWFAIVVAVIAYHMLKYYIEYFEYYVKSIQVKRDSIDSKPLTASLHHNPVIRKDSAQELEPSLTSTMVPNNSYGAAPEYYDGSSLKVPGRFLVAHALLTGLNYGLSLMLMLVAMTYNPSLFLALVVGWVAGDGIFYRKLIQLRIRYGTNNNLQANTDCH